MSSNEKVIAHLNDALQWVADDDDPKGSVAVEIWAVRDALEMLKEQEAKEVNESTNMYTGLPITHCPKCGISLDRYLYGRQHEGQINYCPMCGQKVKWND